jgi:WD40 repeat protein
MRARFSMTPNGPWDYYGKRLATCSSDHTVMVFDMIDGEPDDLVLEDGAFYAVDSSELTFRLATIGSFRGI